jgi:hypothetical protein
MAEKNSTTKNLTEELRLMGGKTYLVFDHQNSAVIAAQLILWALIISLMHQPLD